MAVDFLQDDQGDGVVNTLTVDAVLSERHELVSRVSQFPVEDGGNVTDHVLNEPRRVSIEGFVTDTPILAIGEAQLQAIAGAAALLPSLTAFGFLESLRSDRKPITLLTGLKRYDSMVMSSLNIPRDDRTGHALRFSADFVEVQIVSIQQVTIPADQLQPGKPTQQGAGEVNTGKQVPKSVSDSEIKSIAKQIAEDVKELVGGFLQ